MTSIRPILWATRVMLLIVVLGLVLYACAPPSDISGSVTSPADAEVYGTVKRWQDPEAGVVCWIYYISSTAGSIDCLPVSETLLFP